MRWPRRPLTLGAATLVVVLPCTVGAAQLRAEGSRAAAERPADPISLERIMSDPDWLGRSPQGAYWVEDGESVFFRQERAGETSRALFEIDTAGGEPREIPVAELGSVDFGGGRLSHDGRYKVHAREGDIYVQDLASGARRQFTRTDEEESDPWPLANGLVSYRRASRLLVRDLSSGLEEEPFVLLHERDPEAVEREREEKGTPLLHRQDHLFAVLRQARREWIAEVDLEAARLVPVHHMHDPAWINWIYRDIGWLRGGKTLFYLSEEDGYSRLYLHDLADKSRRPITARGYEVDGPTLSRDGAYLYFTANREHPGIWEVYRVAVPTGEVERMTRLGGNTSFALSPDGRRLLLTHSTATRPPELFVQRAEAGAPAVQLTRTISQEFLRLPWVKPEIVTIRSSHVDRQIYARLYLPPDGDDDALRPAVFFVHGAGYLQNAQEGWMPYYAREFMFNTLLARRGYVVLEMDYRASQGYGREWRTAIYRHMGAPEPEDLEDGVEWLVRTQRVDRDRIGLYGSSYGGFLTLMSLFKRPQLFAAGAALSPVTDWAHFNHHWTSDILNTPDIDPEAFRRSSPIEFADGLERPLLICHGMVDPNVHFQDTVQLAQRLIELGKKNWEIAIYPLERHAFEYASSWLDEYRRILELLERCLMRSDS